MAKAYRVTNVDQLRLLFRAARLNAELRLEDLSALTGLGLTSHSHFENGTKGLSLEAIIATARALGLEILIRPHRSLDEPVTLRRNCNVG
ncbi:MAG TPA: helix-turn-helix transcriptional regulator [Symbiobacteriaceae bacterium]|jgi:transcriptional regulator with XRE-family HTH domain